MPILDQAVGRDLCFRFMLGYPFRLEQREQNKERLIRADVLVRAGLLTIREEKVPDGYYGVRVVYHYDLSAEGLRRLNSDYELCYGRQTIGHIRLIEPIPIAGDPAPAAPLRFRILFEMSNQAPEWTLNPLFQGLIERIPARVHVVTVEATEDAPFWRLVDAPQAQE
jgi:hypothetical protein